MMFFFVILCGSIVEILFRSVMQVFLLLDRRNVNLNLYRAEVSPSSGMDAEIQMIINFDRLVRKRDICRS